VRGLVFELHVGFDALQVGQLDGDLQHAWLGQV